MREFKPWPHNPGVIAQVEVNGVLAGYEARTGDRVSSHATYEAAAAHCIARKQMRRAAFAPATIADEMGA
jgi:hypothetical protein